LDLAVLFGEIIGYTPHAWGKGRRISMPGTSPEERFLRAIDKEIHRRLHGGRGDAALGAAIKAVTSGASNDDFAEAVPTFDPSSEVWDAVSHGLVTFIYAEGGGDSLAVLDFGRGVTYVAIDTNEERGVYDYAIIAEVAANDWDAVREIALSEMRSGAWSGVPLGKWPDGIWVSSPITHDDVRETFRELFVSSESVAEEYNEWMMDNGYEGLPLGTDSEREALADVYLDLVLEEPSSGVPQERSWPGGSENRLARSDFGAGDDDLNVDPATGTPIKDLLVGAATVGSRSVDPPTEDESDPEEVAEVDLPRRGTPDMMGFHKIAFENDEEISELSKAIAAAIVSRNAKLGIKPGTRTTGPVSTITHIGGVAIPEEHGNSREDADAYLAQRARESGE
jgi:hypothetical protein